MSKTLQQIYTLNPRTSFLDTDLFYGVESPYTPNTDFGFSWATLKTQILNLAGSAEQTIYVSPDGNDTTGLGTIEQPFATYEKARSVAVLTATQGHQFVIIPVGQFNITGDMILSPFVNVSGYSNYSTQFDITGSVILDSLFDTIAESTCQVMGIDIAAAGGINLVFSTFQDSQVQFENVDFSNTPTFAASGAGLNINGELVIVLNCISKGSVPSFTFTNLIGVIVSSIASNGVTSINNSAITNNTCVLDTLYGPNSTFLFQTTGSTNQNVLLQNVFMYGGGFTIDGALNQVLVDSSSYMTTPVFANGATQANIVLLSLSDGMQANTNFTPSNYTPVGSANYKADSTTGNFHGIDNAFGSIGVVNTGTLNHLAYYAATGSTISQTTANITTGIQYLSQTGNGVTPNAPAWSTIVVSDVTGAANAPVNTNITSMTGLTGKIQAPTAIADSSGNNVLGFNYVGASTNYLQISNSTPSITAVGTSANINITMNPKSGYVVIYDSASATSGGFILYNVGLSHFTLLKIPNAQLNDIVYELPGTDGAANSPMLTSGAGVLSFTPTTAGTNIIGTTTNGNATAGSVGEFVSSVILASGPIALVSGAAKDITSISLTAGDWDVWGNIVSSAGGAFTNTAGWINNVSVTAPDFSICSFLNLVAGAGMTVHGFLVPIRRFSLSATTTIYLTVSNIFTISATAYGGIYARRVR